MSAAAQPAEGGPVTIHASAVVVGESGIIIRGPSGAGKSSLALSLITAAERAGQFGRLVGDDRVELRRRGGRLIARGHPRVAGMVERRGRGILHMAYESAAVARLVVDILAPEEATRYPQDAKDCVTLCGVGLPVLFLPRDAPAHDSALAVLARIQEPVTI